MLTKLATMERVFPCLTCKKEIRLERKADNTGWNKFNLDGSAHIHENKKSNNNTTSSSTQVAELTKKVETLESKIDTLIAQITMLRSEVKSKK